MLTTCSSSRVISSIVDEIKTISRECLSERSTEQIKESKITEINELEQEYLDNCYFGSESDEEVLMWLRLAKRVIVSCLDDKNKEGKDFVRVTSNLVHLMGKSKDQLISELERRTPYSKVIKELFLFGVQDTVRAVNDENIKMALNIIWSRVYNKLKEALEEYASRRGLLETSLKIELLRDEGLMIEQVFLDLLKSEIDNLLLRIGVAKQSPTSTITMINEILGSVKRIVLLFDVVSGLRGEGFEQIEKEITKLKTTAMLFERISTYDSLGVSSILDSLASIMSQIKGFLAR